MKKKILASLLAVAICIALTGCVNKKNNNDNNNQSEQGVNEENIDAEIKLYSDDKTIVFDFLGAYKMVFYYSGDKITGHELFYDFGDSATASIGKASIEANLTDEDNVESVKQNGRYIIVKYKEIEFRNMTVEEIKTIYSYLKEIQKSN